MQLSHQKEFYGIEKPTSNIRLREVIARTWKNEGFKGFYGGLGVDMVKVLPTNTILMLSFEYFRHLVRKSSQDGPKH